MPSPKDTALDGVDERSQVGIKNRFRVRMDITMNEVQNTDETMM